MDRDEIVAECGGRRESGRGTDGLRHRKPGYSCLGLDPKRREGAILMAASQWYVAEAGRTLGPFPTLEVVGGVRNGRWNPSVQVCPLGAAAWAPASSFAELRVDSSVARGAQAPPPPPTRMHEVDYDIHGEEMQFVEVELDPGEGAIAEAGSMMFMESGIQMNTIFGDGNQTGFMDKLLGAGKRLLTGESLFMTEFVNQGAGKQRVAFASPYPGKIQPVHLAQVGGQLIAQKDAFLCAAKGVALGIAFQKKIGTALFGGEGFIMQRLEGDGLAFLHAGGTIVRKDLGPGENLRVDSGCLVALAPSVDYDIQFVGGIKSAIFGGEGFFFASLTGPGWVWLQSLPFSRLAGRIHQAAPQTGGGGKGEGSLLGRISGVGWDG